MLLWLFSETSHSGTFAKIGSDRKKNLHSEANPCYYFGIVRIIFLETKLLAEVFSDSPWLSKWRV